MRVYVEGLTFREGGHFALRVDEITGSGNWRLSLEVGEGEIGASLSAKIGTNQRKEALVARYGEELPFAFHGAVWGKIEGE